MCETSSLGRRFPSGGRGDILEYEVKKRSRRRKDAESAGKYDTFNVKEKIGMDRTELVSQVRAGRAELEAAMAHFDRHDLNAPLLPNGWSIKDVIAHLGAWERRMVTLFDILRSGDAPQDTVQGDGVDQFNARAHEESQLLPLGIVQINELEAYQALVHIAETAPEEDLFDPQRFAWTEGDPFYRFILVNTSEHYADHIPDLVAQT